MRHASLQTIAIYLHAEHDLRHAETVREQSECVLPHSWRQRKAVRRIAEPSNSQYFRVDADTRVSTTGKQGIQIEDAVSPNIAVPDRCFISRRLREHHACGKADNQRDHIYQRGESVLSQSA